MLKRLSVYFVRGLLFFIPAVVTIYLFYVAFVKLDRILGFRIPGLGLVVSVAFITFLGFLASNFVTRRFVYLMDRLLTHIPLVKLLYSSIKDITGALVGEKKTFEHPVVVDLSPDGKIKLLGFITREDLDVLGLKDQVSVYLPQCYNFGGNLIIAPKERVKPLDVEGAQMMTFILSGGVAGASELQEVKR